MMFEGEFEDIQYDNTKSIDQYLLIAEVKKWEPLYNNNRQSGEYVSNDTKEQIWELIHAVLFPNYKQLNEEIKDIIRSTVRKRWKSLRDALVKDHRLRGEDPIYAKKKMSRAVKEMQYLTPFIKYPRKRSEIYGERNYSPDSCKFTNDTTIDLTYQEEPEDSYVQVDDDMLSNEALYPSVHMTTSEAESEEVEWRDPPNQGTLKYTIREVEEPEIKEELEVPEIKEEEYEMIEQFPNVAKRKRSDSKDNLHLKLNALIDRCNEESQDQDRMFLLSLLSDFKRVPVHKKLKVKSAFIKALYEALD
ncbi:uncharacterized protein LOC129918141 [Episyrphus balteatus]|uniref:uncharacterized protein LOC129918141 n=1 Tax=Episyrphus balteatus TaxID=286459 RepID=UPI002486C676|nr:uncharacterized protein LOC129918141 [Episyrphus balteatus]XP_055854486.1 uncharacterized protein LOC129918141 [Episyrphus balteatus]